MDGNSETLKQQFQLLQEQQQRKLQRRKQQKEEKQKNKEESKAEEKVKSAFGVHDNLELKLADPVPKGAGYISEELVEHLNQQIRELKDENGRVYKLLSEKDFEIRNLRKKQEASSTGTSGVTNETAATKIVELSKKIRELTAELEAEKTKSKKFALKCRQLDSQISSIPEETRSLLGSAVSLRSQVDEKTIDPADYSKLQDKLKQADLKTTEFRNQCSSLKQEIKIVQKALSQEVGENVNVQNILNSNSGWRGRAQQILSLQSKVEELKSQLAAKNGDNSIENEMLGNSSARRRGAEERHREQLRKLEKERKEAQERQANELKFLETEHEALKKKLDAAKTRNKVLSNEMKANKQQMQTLLQKGQHDDELIQALMEQLAKLKELMEKTTMTQNLTAQQQEAQYKQLSMKTQQDTNIVEQLKAIVTEKEAKVHTLEEEIRQLKLNHLHKAQMEGVNQIFQQSRPQSNISNVEDSENIELEYRLSSVTPSQSRMSDRPPTVNDTRPSTYTMEDEKPHIYPRPSSKPPINNALDSSRPSSRKMNRTPTFMNNKDTEALNELKYQCHEYHTVMQASEVEREKLSELVKILQSRLSVETEKLNDIQNDLVQQRRKNALLEKQIGKNKVENNKSNSAVPRKRQQQVSARGLGNPLTASMTGKDMLGLSEDDNVDGMAMDELKTSLEIQRDENEALKAALQSTLKAKEEDLQMYYNIMEETKKVFLEALRQYKQNVT